MSNGASADRLPPTVPLTVMVPPDLRDELRELARIEDRSMGSIVRMAATRYLAEAGLYDPQSDPAALAAQE